MQQIYTCLVNIIQVQTTFKSLQMSCLQINAASTSAHTKIDKASTVGPETQVKSCSVTESDK